MATGPTLTITGAEDLRRKYLTLAEVMKPGSEMTKLLKRIVAYMQGSVDKNFRQEGRPDHWKPLAPSTIRARRKGRGKHGSGARILQDTGRLKQSLSFATPGADTVMEIKGTSAIFGTRVEYARTHQFGATIQGTHWSGKGFGQKRGTHSILIPARPFLLFQQEDKRAITGIVRSFVAAFDREHRVKP